MAVHTLYPCSCALRYHSAYAPHVMTIPLTAWSPVSSGHDSGTNLAWDSSQVDTKDMITGLVDLLIPFFDTNTHFDGYTIFTYATITGPALPQSEATFMGKVGTSSATIPASMASYIFRTAGFGSARIILLDTVVTSTFQPKTVLLSPADDDEIALINYWMDDGNAFAGRDGTQVTFWRKITYKLNDALRKEYRLS